MKKGHKLLWTALIEASLLVVFSSLLLNVNEGKPRNQLETASKILSKMDPPAKREKH